MKQAHSLSYSHPRSQLLGRRGELLAELFLQDLSPDYIARPSEDFGYDFLVGFSNSKGGINTFGVAVKSTENPVSSSMVVDRRTYDLLTHSTIPGFLLLADVKENRLFWGWPPRVDTRHSGAKSVRIPLQLVEEKNKEELRKRLVAS